MTNWLGCENSAQLSREMLLVFVSNNRDQDFWKAAYPHLEKGIIDGLTNSSVMRGELDRMMELCTKSPSVYKKGDRIFNIPIL